MTAPYNFWRGTLELGVDMSEATCPTCGQGTVDLTLCKTELFLHADGLRLGPVQTAILLALKAGPLTTPQLVERVYGTCRDAPDFPMHSIRTAVYKMSRKLPRFGWAISNFYGSGRNGAVWRLHQVSNEIEGIVW